MRKLGGAFALVVVLMGVALADTITKTDGTVIEGDVVAEDEGSVTIKCKLGELKIDRAEIAKLTKGSKYDAEGALLALKADTLAKLHQIESSCEDAAMPKKARAAFDLQTQVRAWTLTPVAATAPAEGARPPASPASDQWKGLEWAKTLERIGRIRVDGSRNKVTSVQMQKSIDAIAAETDGKVARASLKIDDTRPAGAGMSFSVTAQVLELPPSTSGTGLSPVVFHMTLFFEPGPEKDWFEKQPRGATFKLDGTVKWNRDAEGPVERHYHEPPSLVDYRLVK